MIFALYIAEFSMAAWKGTFESHCEIMIFRGEKAEKWTETDRRRERERQRGGWSQTGRGGETERYVEGERERE